MLKRCAIFAWVAMSTVVFAEGATNDPLPELTEARDKCQTRMTQLWEEYHEQIIIVRSRYINALAKLESDIKKTGNLEGVSAVQSERKRFSKYKNWDPGKYGKVDKHVVSIFNSYAKIAKDLDSTYEGQCKTLNQAYRIHLEKLKKSLTVSDRIQDAVRVKQELDSMTAIEPVRSKRPPLPKGKTAVNIKTPDQLAAHLNRTRWKLMWRAGEIPATQTEKIEFHFGQIFRFVGADGSEKKYRYSVGDDLSVKVESRRGKSLVFDPSFTVFEYSDEYYRTYRRGFLEGSLDQEEAASLREDMILYLPFDEVAEYLRDFSGLKNHAKVHMTSVVFYGKKGNAYLFDGRKSLVEVRKPIDPDDYEGFSVSLWVKILQEIKYAPIFGWEKDGDYGGFYLRTDRGHFRARFGSGHEETYASGCGKYKEGEWYHVVVAHSREGGNMVYVNGELVHSHPAKPLKNNNSTLRIGGRKLDGQSGDYFRGLIDDLMVFKRALTPDDVKRLHELRAFRIVTKSPAKEADTGDE
ncbi:MAG: LamG domain-containing protein [Kiritimatiellia bacterium]|jgi:hypothetical protein|nr:LamG domain-containing protein [Kiritimatiellia bacterium]MDP6848614.1 LamG domain-containing protein [Kiritimatiellia bacterium]